MSAFNSPESLQLNPNGIHLTQFITVQAAAEATGYNLQYLRRLLRAGKLAGIKIGQVWLISLVSLAIYLHQAEEVIDRRCGPKAGGKAEVYTNVYNPGLQMYTGTEEGGKS